VPVCAHDGPGVQGADALLARIRILKTKFVPSGKDMRSFIKDGGTVEALHAMLGNLLPIVGKSLAVG